MKMKKKQYQERNIGLIKNRKLIAPLIGTATAVLFYLIFGAVTAIIPNKFFTRMTSFGLWEEISLLVTSLLLGIYIGLAYYDKSTRSSKVCNTTATAGGVFGFLTFGCSICNKILVFFLGVAGVFTYFEPIRPFLGIFSILFLGFTIFNKTKNISSS